MYVFKHYINFLTDECVLYCRDGQTNFYYNRGSVEDGTHCNKDTGACVNNVCEPMNYEDGKERLENVYMHSSLK